MKNFLNSIQSDILIYVMDKAREECEKARAIGDKKREDFFLALFDVAVNKWDQLK